MPRFLPSSLLAAAALFAGCATEPRTLRQNTVEGIDAPADGERRILPGATAAMVERALGVPPIIRAEASGTSTLVSWIYPDETEGELRVTFRDGQVAEVARDADE